MVCSSYESQGPHKFMVTTIGYTIKWPLLNRSHVLHKLYVWYVGRMWSFFFMIRHLYLNGIWQLMTLKVKFRKICMIVRLDYILK